MRAYINRFRRSQRLLKSVGIDISHTYDSESLGARLLDRCGLSQEAQRMILVGTGQKLEFEALAEAMLLQYPDFRGAPPVTNRDGVVQQPKGLGKGSSKGSKSSSSLTSSTASFSSSSLGKGSGPRKQVHLTEVPEVEDGGDEFLDTIDENDDDQQNDDDAEAFDDQQEQPGDEEYDDSPDLGELAEVLTLTAKKLSGITLGRKFSGRPDKKPKGQSKGSIADKKRVTNCSACGGKGHWHDDPECPLNGGKGGQSQPRDNTSAASSSSSNRVNKVGIIHHEHGATDVLAAPSSYGNLFTVQMVQHPPQLPHDVNEVSINGPEGFAGYMILDTGCQRTCCGELWFQAHTQRLRELNLHPRVIEFPDSFKFGKGTPSNSQLKMYTPSAIEGVPLLLAASILSEKIPFLASNSLMTELGAVFNTVDDVIVFARLEGAKAKIHRIGGHMALCITEFLHDNPSSWSAWHEFSRSTVWTSPHPEFILSTQTHPVDLPSLFTGFWMIQPPPAWLKAWRLIVTRMKFLFKNMVINMLQVINLGMAPRSLLLAIPPQLDSMKVHPKDCKHNKCKRYGNAHGRYADCLECGTKWIWSKDKQLWVDRFEAEAMKSPPHGSKSRSSRLQPLPPPSSMTIAPAGAMPKAGYTSRPSELRARAKTRPASPRTLMSGPWTNFYLMEHSLDHLSEENYMLAWNIMEEQAPFTQEPRSFEEHAFYNEEIFAEDRKKITAKADQERWDKLLELGVISTEGNEIYDWEQVNP